MDDELTPARALWDWIAPTLSAPYVPTFGPVHPSLFNEDRFADILHVGPGEFLPYDKDARWSAVKDERILPHYIAHRDGETLIPTLSERGGARVYAYGADTGLAFERARMLAYIHGRARVVRILGPDAEPRGVRVQMQDFTAGRVPPPDRPVVPYADLPAAARQDFAAFAGRMASDGFEFLREQMQRGKVGPVLVAVADDRVAGAIGPMEIQSDAAGRPQLLPQYFGVLPEQRGRGIGRALWRGAMAWGQSHGAAYQLLQTTVGGASDRLCQGEGLASLGFVVATAV